jgi:phosphoserine phosphatase RsbU/P
MQPLQRENENLRRILDVTRRMAVTPDLDALLETIIDAACQVLDCERATIFLYDAAGKELYSRVARGVDGIRFPADRGIAGAAAQQRVCVNVPDAYADARFNQDVDRRTGFRTRNLLTFPLENNERKLIGVLQALNKRQGHFSTDDEELALTLAAQTGVVLDRGRLIDEYVLKQRMARDLDIARQIQLGLLPKRDPQIPGYEIAGWSQSADETGGDCFDFIPLPDGRLAIFIADATGHGIGPALVIAQARSILRTLLSMTTDLPRVVGGLNDFLASDLSDDRFVTAFIGILDADAGRITYISAGQGPLLRITEGGGLESRSATGLPLGIMSGFGFESAESFELTPDATVVVLTDGFYETANAAGDLFGEQRVAELILASRQRPLRELIGELHRAVKDYSAGLPQADDLTAVLVRRALS